MLTSFDKDNINYVNLT